MKLPGDRGETHHDQKEVERDEGPAEKAGNQSGSVTFSGDGFGRLRHLTGYFWQERKPRHSKRSKTVHSSGFFAYNLAQPFRHAHQETI